MAATANFGTMGELLFNQSKSRAGLEVVHSAAKAPKT